MNEPREEGAAAQPLHDVVRAHRFELIDVKGRIRSVLGAAPQGPLAQAGVIEDVDRGDGSYGFTLLDSQGSAKATLTTDEESVDVALYVEGNTALVLRAVAPHRDVVLPGAHVILCAGDGSLVARWHATPSGELFVESPNEPSDEG